MIQVNGLSRCTFFQFMVSIFIVNGFQIPKGDPITTRFPRHSTDVVIITQNVNKKLTENNVLYKKNFARAPFPETSRSKEEYIVYVCSIGNTTTTNLPHNSTNSTDIAAGGFPSGEIGPGGGGIGPDGGGIGGTGGFNVGTPNWSMAPPPPEHSVPRETDQPTTATAAVRSFKEKKNRIDEDDTRLMIGICIGAPAIFIIIVVIISYKFPHLR